MSRSYYRSLEDTDPSLQKRLRYKREWHAAKQSDSEYRLRNNQRRAIWWKANSQAESLRKWVTRRTQTELNEFTWKTHVPVVFAEPVRKTCVSCGLSRRRGSRVWWQRLTLAEKKPESVSEAESGSQHESGSGAFDCHKCHTKDMKNNVLPLGHEDFVFGEGRSLEP